MSSLVNDQRISRAALRWAMVVFLGATLTGGTRAADVPDGRQLFKKYCTHCHSVRKLTPVLRERLSAEREDFLERYIASHHGPPSPAERKALAAYLSKAVE